VVKEASFLLRFLSERISLYNRIVCNRYWHFPNWGTGVLSPPPHVSASIFAWQLEIILKLILHTKSIRAMSTLGFRFVTECGLLHDTNVSKELTACIFRAEDHLNLVPNSKRTYRTYITKSGRVLTCSKTDAVFSGNEIKTVRTLCEWSAEVNVGAVPRFQSRKTVGLWNYTFVKTWC
jgi:hypothetical protein